MTTTRAEERAASATVAPRREPLSCARIVDAATRYIDRHCIAELSMRKLGAELGVEAMSLYRYFPNKAALLDAVVSAALESVPVPSADDPDWAAAIRAWAGAVRRLARRHPRVFPLLVSLGHDDPRVVVFARSMDAVWRGAGFDPATAARARGAIVAYTLGSTLFELGGSMFRPPGGERQGRDEQGVDAAAGSGPVAAAGAPDHEVDFEFGLELLIEALARKSG